MARPDTIGLKQYLKGRMRNRVPHPSREGHEVKVEDVTRSFWSFRQDGELHVRQFAAMRPEEIERVMGGEE